MIDPQAILRRILNDLGQRELALVRSYIGSRTLRAAIQLIVDEAEGRADLHIPHYWAVYYHDGRGGFSAPAGKKLVYFMRPEDDPRLAGGRPVTRAQVRRLTKRQFERGLEINRQRRARGERPFMIVTDSVGPSEANPFFERLEQGSAARADDVVFRNFEAELLRQLDADRAFRPETRRASFRLRF